MIKKFAIAFFSLVAVCCAAAFAACAGDVDYDEKYSDRTKIVFELEGGKYKNSTTSVSHYYKFGEGAPKKIKPLGTQDNPVTRDGGFVLEGWFRGEKSDGVTVYGEQWNFDTDAVPDGGITLYAKWKSPIIYSFDFISVDASGGESVINSLEVNAGDKLANVHPKDVLEYANKLSGHTAIAVYYDKEHTRPFDDSVLHPGGDKSFAVKIYIEFIEGDYAIVRNASDLKKAKSKNIYVMPGSVIDMGGEELRFDNFSGKTFLGNGSTVKNFTLKKDWRGLIDELEPDIGEEGSANSVYLAIFRNADNATVRDVSFEGVTLTVDIGSLSRLKKVYVAPLAVQSHNSTFENVSVEATFGYTERTERYELIFLQDKGVYSGNAVETNCVYDVTLVGRV